MSDGFTTGWDHAVWLLGYLSGVSWLLLLVAPIFAAVWWAENWLAHRIHVRRLRRQTRRSGRLEGPGWNGAD